MRLSWECVKVYHFAEIPEVKKEDLKLYLPIATVFFFIGCMLISAEYTDSFLSRYIYTLSSAIPMYH
jgi:hypothetical protein